MKDLISRNKIMLFCLIFLAISNVNCQKMGKENILSLDKVAYSTCENQNELRSVQESDPLQEYISYKTIDSHTLRIKQGLVINCCCDSISVKISSNNNEIIVDVYDYGNTCNCICSGLVNYDITGLQEKTTYSFIFKQNNNIHYTSNIEFASGLDQTILINGEN